MRVLIATNFLKQCLKVRLQIFMESMKWPQSVSGSIKFITPEVIYGPGNCCKCFAEALCGKPGSSQDLGAQSVAGGPRLGGRDRMVHLLL